MFPPSRGWWSASPEPPSARSDTRPARPGRAWNALIYSLLSNPLAVDHPVRLLIAPNQTSSTRVNSLGESVGPAFRAAFCERYQCATGDFETAVLRRCFPLWARVPGTILLAIKPHLFRRELTLINRLGDARNESQARQDLEGYAYENMRDKSFRTESLGLRFSRRRFLRLMHSVLRGTPNDRHSRPR